MLGGIKIPNVPPAVIVSAITIGSVSRPVDAGGQRCRFPG